MATWTDVARILEPLPGIERDASKRMWRVKNKLVAWERPLRPADLAALGAAAPRGNILGVHVPHELKALLLASKPEIYFVTPHFTGYPALMLRLGKIRAGELRDLLEEVWRARAPRKLVAARTSR